jgi:hypothetical protein
MSWKGLSVWMIERSYSEFMAGFDDGCPFCTIVHSAATRVIKAEKLSDSAFLKCRMTTLPGSLHSQDDLGAEIQRKEAGQKANAGRLSNDFSSPKISAPKALRRMKLFYCPIKNAPSWEEEEIGWLDMYALEGLLTSIEVFKE